MPRPVFKTGLAGITLAGEFDSLPPPPLKSILFAKDGGGSRIGSPTARGPLKSPALISRSRTDL